MRRRHPKNRSESPDDGTIVPAPDELEPLGDEGAGEGGSDSWAQWEEKWDRPEEERVARWLRSKVHPEVDLDLRDTSGGRSAGSVRRSDADVSFFDEQRQRIAATVEAQRINAERVRQQQRVVRARLEAELSDLDEERLRLAAAVEAERVEAERLHNEQLEARARLEAEVSDLDGQTQLLAAAVEAKRAEAERVRVEHQAVRARLEAQLAALDEQRRHFVAAVDAEREEARRLHDEQLEARARLEAHVADLQAQQRRFADAIEAKRAAAEAVEAKRAAAEAAEAVETLEAVGPVGVESGVEAVEAVETLETVGTVEATSGVEAVGPVDVGSGIEAEGTADAKAKLASAVSELAQYLTAAREAERAEAERMSEKQSEGDAGTEAVVSTGADPRLPRPAVVQAKRPRGRRVPTWLVMTVLALGPVGLIVFEAASPVVVRAQLEGVARDAVDAAVIALLDHNDAQRARSVAQEIAHDSDAVVKSLTVDQLGLHVVVGREAQSLVLKHWDRTRDWYDVEASATAAVRRN